MTFLKAITKMDLDPDWLMRIFTVIPALLILMAGAGAIWIYFFALSLLPEGQSVVETPGLTADVRVVRDSNGVPGIIGHNEEDLAFILGYVMAQDRLWQMDYLRRAGQGRLAEILGHDYLESDHLMRTVTTGILAKETARRLGDQERKWLDRFVQGINKYISGHAGKLPVEFSLLEYRPTPFSSDDVHSIMLAVAWGASPAVRVDPTMTQIMGRLGKDRALSLFPTDPAASPAFVASDLIGWEPHGILFSRGSGGRASTRIPGFRGGCAWAVGKERSRSGKPLTSSAVYQVMSAPGFWYRARLVSERFSFSGAFIPGVPVAMAGNNGRMSWGAVSSLADDADLFIERLDSDEAASYWRVDRRRRIEEKTERYRVRGGSSVSRTIRLTETGPLVSDANRGRALSLRWTARDGLGFYSAFYALNRAGDREQIRAALKGMVAPCLDVVWADEGANFGIQTAGLIPVRPPDSDGILPMPAWTGVHDWIGFIPFDELPASTNPSDGYAVVADGRPGGADYPFFVSCYWNNEARRSRIKELLTQTVEQNPESSQTIQGDIFSPMAQALVPLLLKAAKPGISENDQLEQDALAALRSWDYRMAGDSNAPAVFSLFYQSLVENLFLSPLGDDLYREFSDHPPLVSRVVKKIFLENRTEWLSGVDPEHVLTKSFQAGLDRGKSSMGANLRKWKWADINAELFRHPIAARSRFLESMYQVGPLHPSGSFDSISLAGWSFSNPFTILEGVSLRQIADMTEPPQVYSASPLGSSAHFFSSHYKDQTIAWLKGRSFRDPVHTADIRKDGANTVLFKSVPPAAASLQP
jgi:penicillin G amidase